MKTDRVTSQIFNNLLKPSAPEDRVQMQEPMGDISQSNCNTAQKIHPCPRPHYMGKIIGKVVFVDIGIDELNIMR